MIWDAANQKKLKNLWGKGFSGTEIAKMFGVTRCAILGKVRRMNLAKRRVDTSVKKKKALKPKPITHDNAHAIMALREGTCRFPLGNPGEVYFRFCLAPVTGRSVYCLEHQKLCYEPPKGSMGGTSKGSKSE